MSGVLKNTFTVILSVEFVIGNFGNVFIAVVNIIDLVKRRKISSMDQILTALAISRIVLLWLVLLNWCISMLYPGEWINERMVGIIHSIWTASHQFSLWLATSLSIFCFFKIANFSNTLFFYIKLRVKKAVRVTLFVSLFLLCLNIIVINLPENILMTEYKVNESYNLSLNNLQHSSLWFLFANTMFAFIPFAVSLVTFLLLIFSLWKHLRKMQHSAQGCRDASTTAHIRTLQIMIASLLLYVLFFLSLLANVWGSLLLEKQMLLLFTQSSRVAFPSVHPCILILGNTKLRKASLSVLLWLRCRQEDRDPELIEHRWEPAVRGIWRSHRNIRKGNTERSPSEGMDKPIWVPERFVQAVENDEKGSRDEPENNTCHSLDEPPVWNSTFEGKDILGFSFRNGGLNDCWDDHSSAALVVRVPAIIPLPITKKAKQTEDDPV
ncbi:taste receptor type 2 member 116-like [Microtus oregoni]|uniref:taste receptor type 2 member 116-like n=1 Tax=Microtus oregoni TaxID=111838 RepID=UPI001BB2AD8B|nr:taste receptor type 2 member 116-like [Microtus oregoni]